jgi:hypothetical protein
MATNPRRNTRDPWTPRRARFEVIRHREQGKHRVPRPFAASGTALASAPHSVRAGAPPGRHRDEILTGIGVG